MANHGKCERCWWWKELLNTDNGLCYMQNDSHGNPYKETSKYSYCPDYINRKKKNGKYKTVDEFIFAQADELAEKIWNATLTSKICVEKVLNSTFASKISPVTPSEKPQEWLTWDGNKPTETTIKKPNLYDDDCKNPFTDEILDKVSEILHISREVLKDYTIRWGFGGKVMVSTPDYTWKTLCGREWEVDLENNTAHWTRMS